MRICFCVYAHHAGFVREVPKDSERDFNTNSVCLCENNIILIFCFCFVQGYEGDMSSQSTLNRSRSTGSLKSLGRGDSPGPLTRRKSMLEMPEFDGPSKYNKYLEGIVLCILVQKFTYLLRHFQLLWRNYFQGILLPGPKIFIHRSTVKLSTLRCEILYKNKYELPHCHTCLWH